MDIFAEYIFIVIAKTAVRKRGAFID